MLFYFNTASLAMESTIEVYFYFGKAETLVFIKYVKN
jgi:hypothetical protein